MEDDAAAPGRQASQGTHFKPPTGPGRCTGCGFYVARQGHRSGCHRDAPVTPGEADFGATRPWPDPSQDFIGNVKAADHARSVFLKPVGNPRGWRVKSGTRGDAHARLRGVAEHVSKQTEGVTNNALNWAAHKMRGPVASGELTIHEVRDALWNACITNGYIQRDGENQTLATIASGLGVSKADLC